MKQSNFVNMEHYLHMKKLAVQKKFLPFWANITSVPKNILRTTPVRIFGFYIGSMFEVVDEDYKDLFFTD